jgi:hypothetical protein
MMPGTPDKASSSGTQVGGSPGQGCVFPAQVGGAAPAELGNVDDAARVVITDLALVAKRERRADGSHAVRAWALQSKDNRAASEVEVKLVRPSGQVLARCTTGRDGACVPYCPVRPSTFGFYGTQWRRWPGAGVVPVSNEQAATPSKPPKSSVPGPDEESLGPKPSELPEPDFPAGEPAEEGARSAVPPEPEAPEPTAPAAESTEPAAATEGDVDDHDVGRERADLRERAV